MVLALAMILTSIINFKHKGIMTKEKKLFTTKTILPKYSTCNKSYNNTYYYI